MKIKINDKIKVIRGKESGKEAKVIQVFPLQEKIVAEGLNMMKKHLRARKSGEKGQVIELATPFAAANALIICTKCGRPARIGFKTEGGAKKRVCKKCGEFID